MEESTREAILPHVDGNVVRNGEYCGQGGVPRVLRWCIATPCTPLLRITSSVWATFQIFYGICMEENTCEAKLPDIKRDCGKQIEHIGERLLVPRASGDHWPLDMALLNQGCVIAQRDPSSGSVQGCSLEGATLNQGCVIAQRDPSSVAVHGCCLLQLY